MTMLRRLTIYKAMLIAVVTLIVLFILLLRMIWVDDSAISIRPMFLHAESRIQDEYFIYNSGCRIPKVNYRMSERDKSFVQSHSELYCELIPRLAYHLKIYVDRKIWVFRSSMTKNVSCGMRHIYRKTKDEVELSKEMTIGQIGVLLESEFVRVECLLLPVGKVVYRQFYPVILRKRVTEERIRNHPPPSSKTVMETKSFSVILLGFESLSKKNFLRYMLQSQDYIKNEFTYIELNGYSKIGNSSYANVVPMFTGMLNKEMEKLKSDVLPLIWKDYAKQGYRTLLAESLRHPSIFSNGGRKGFHSTPSDYYLHPLSIAVRPYTKKWKRGCLNEKPELDVIMQWTLGFMDAFLPDPIFALTYFQSSEDLEHLNKRENVAYLKHQDTALRDFLENLRGKEFMLKSFVFVFGGTSHLRTNYLGNAVPLDSELPVMFILIPDWFPAKYPHLYLNLKTNQHRLVTPLDVFATLTDLRRFSHVAAGTSPPDNLRGASLFRDSISANRTCKEAGIKKKWCVCV